MLQNQSVLKNTETLHKKFYENSLEYPERLALIYGNDKVSYSTLRNYALRAANYMIQKGVKRGDAVVVILPRGIEQIAAVLGILAIGAVYVPISIKQPLARREKIIQSVNPKIVLKNEAFMKEKMWKGCIENNPEDTAYIIYTSGSTGEPKGVEMSHMAAMNTIVEILHMFNIGPTDSILNISAFDFDLAVFDIFGILTAGGTIVLIDEKEYRDPEAWRDLIEIHGITLWNSAPALLDMFLTLEKGKNYFKKLRLALVSGDWIPLYLPEEWYKVTESNSKFVALGGATEGGIWSNYYCVSKVEKSWNSIPYGKALPGQKYRIVDEKLENCNIKIPGELLIGGNSLAKGYINDQELTKKKFIVDDAEGERWYRTGDRGMYWEDGTIEFLGRIDTQIKIRGHRIELGEIESVLEGFPGIKRAAVIFKGDKYHKELVAFFSGDDVVKSGIENYLKLYLPEFSIPNFVIQLDKLPLSDNGKVDRKSLEKYEIIKSKYNLPNEPVSIVLEIWKELLGYPTIDLEENLFKIGADSLMAARFVEILNTRYGIKSHIRDIFEKPTIGELTDWINKDEKTNTLEFEEGEI